MTADSADPDAAESTDIIQPADGPTSPASPLEAFEKFKKEVLDENQPRQLFSVSRMEGSEALKGDIFVHYKDRRTKFRARPRVRFENEEGVGSGPLREFLLNARKICDEGLGSPCGKTKPVIFFEGQSNHRIPIHDQSLRLLGAFKAIGRIIGHCALHGGPALHGLSPAVKYYWIYSEEDIDEKPAPIVIEDVPDIDLRQLILQVRFL